MENKNPTGKKFPASQHTPSHQPLLEINFLDLFNAASKIGDKSLKETMATGLKNIEDRVNQLNEDTGDSVLGIDRFLLVLSQNFYDRAKLSTC